MREFSWRMDKVSRKMYLLEYTYLCCYHCIFVCIFYNIFNVYHSVISSEELCFVKRRFNKNTHKKTKTVAPARGVFYTTLRSRT